MNWVASPFYFSFVIFVAIKGKCKQKKHVMKFSMWMESNKSAYKAQMVMEGTTKWSYHVRNNSYSQDKNQAQ
jgi:hypothetical protein